MVDRTFISSKKIESMRNWIKRHKILLSFAFINLATYLVIWQPHKAIDPDSPLFVKSCWFELNDYNFKANELAKAMVKLFPLGTSEEYVDLMLVKRGGARKGCNEELLDKTQVFIYID